MNRAERRAHFLSSHRQATLQARLLTQSTGYQSKKPVNFRAPDPPLASASKVQLHIEELVLHGFDPRGRYSISDAVQQELTQLFTGQGVPAQLTELSPTERIDAGSFQVGAAARTHAVGAQIANAVYGGARR
jgi:hypothetical protein